jgi:hypothetical protein
VGLAGAGRAEQDDACVESGRRQVLWVWSMNVDQAVT